MKGQLSLGALAIGIAIGATALAAACDCSIMRASNWLGPLDAAMVAFKIDTAERAAAFLAQIAHESGRLQYVRELWGPTQAQSRYEGRRDLGNTHPGDGYRYRGRGLIQTTGRTNYGRTRDGLRLAGVPDVPDFVEQPEALEVPKWAAMSAGWYWKSHGCNELADVENFDGITRAINGGLNGQPDRLALWERAKRALNA